MDSSAVITLTHVDYFDTSGHRVRRYLEAPRQLRPLETVEFTVAANDDAGGSGANFLVYWEGPSDAHSLLTETVMTGHLVGGYIVITSYSIHYTKLYDVRLDFPSALMERAAASGMLAANTLLAPYGVAPEPLRSVPPVGLLAPPRRFARA